MCGMFPCKGVVFREKPNLVLFTRDAVNDDGKEALLL
jgi:hypothetical protein